jgi:hypothetical protein
MDLHALLGYLTSLAMLYAWTLFAAGLFAVGESACRSLFARQTAPSDSKNRPNG